MSSVFPNRCITPVLQNKSASTEAVNAKYDCLNDFQSCFNANTNNTESTFTSAESSPEKNLPTTIFHHQKVFWTHLLDTKSFTDIKFEVLEGVVVFKDEMNTNPAHNKLMNLVPQALSMRDSTLNVNWINTSQIPPSHGSEDTPSFTVPDFAISLKGKRSNSISSTLISERASKILKNQKFVTAEAAELLQNTLNQPHDFVAEITSISTRKTDLNFKWIKYCDAGISTYAILDIAHNAPSVIVGCLEQKDKSWVMSMTGDPEHAPLMPVSQREGKLKFYFYKRFVGLRFVDVPILCSLGLKATHILCHVFMERFVEKMRAKMEKIRQENSILKKELEILNMQFRLLEKKQVNTSTTLTLNREQSAVLTRPKTSKLVTLRPSASSDELQERKRQKFQ